MKRIPPPPRPWSEIPPEDADGIDLTQRLDITAPHNLKHERCAWPWNAQVADPSRGKFDCPHCGMEVTAGAPHPEVVRFDEAYTERYHNPHARAPWWTTFKAWHNTESLYREIYARTVSSTLAAFIVYASPRPSGTSLAPH